LRNVSAFKLGDDCRSFNCDRVSGQSFEHRKEIVERRILALGNTFALDFRVF